MQFVPPRERRLFVILGAFGTGKTEFAINLALKLSMQGRRTALADLDLVNPYFRSREKESLLKDMGIALIAPKGALRDADLPSIPPSLKQLLFDVDMTGVLDIGGDRTGARVLGQFAGEIAAQNPAVWYVYNHSRFDNRTTEAALTSLRQIESQSGLSVNGLVNNTHLLRETTLDTVKNGAKGAEALSDLVKLPLICHCVSREIAGSSPGISPMFVMDLHMNRPWEEA